jgi:hypothetical protein
MGNQQKQSLSERANDFFVGTPNRALWTGISLTLALCASSNSFFDHSTEHKHFLESEWHTNVTVTDEKFSLKGFPYGLTSEFSSTGPSGIERQGLIYTKSPWNNNIIVEYNLD